MPPAPPAITYWNRLEPRVRSNDLANALAARVRDPAWFLARQWQLGEFKGEDAATPAYLKLVGNMSRVTAWAAENGTPSATGGLPHERAITQEPFSPDDVSTRVELGQELERLLTEQSAAALIPEFRTKYPIPAAPVAPAPTDDPRAARLRALWQGRAIDGLAAYLAAKPILPAIPPQLDIPPGDVEHVRSALYGLVAWVEEVCGVPAVGDPATWVPARLEYAAVTYAGFPEPGGQVVKLAAHPDREGQLPWYAFDHAQTLGSPPPGVPAPTAVPVEATVLPSKATFRGMPSTRFWEFEDSRVDFGGLTPDRRDIARLILADFMLVHGTDWFLIPFEMDVGSTCKATITVKDVFGEVKTVDRADAGPGPRWTMFSTFIDSGGAGTLADYFFLPASVATVAQNGEPIEEVRFLRDDLANLVWAVERETEGHLGTPVAGADRGTPTTTEAPFTTPLRYRLQTYVPNNWVPFQPVKLDGSTHEIGFARSAMLGAAGEVQPDPWSKILKPTGIVGTYRVREEEVPREGTGVMRAVRWSRWIDGSSHVWVARRRGVGTGEGSSALRFDLALTPE